MAGHVATTDDAGGAFAELPAGYRWVVLFGVWLIYASFGMTVVSLAPLVLAITNYRFVWRVAAAQTALD